MNQQKSPKRKKNVYRNAAMLSGIAFEMGAIIYLFVKGGKWMDTHYAMEKRLFTALGAILGVALSLWVVLRQLKRIQKT